MTNPPPFDRKKLAQKLLSAPTPQDDFIFELIWGDLADRVGTMARDFSKSLLAAPLPHHLRKTLNTGAQNINFDVLQTLHPEQNLPDLTKMQGQYDLVVSLYDFAIVNDVPAYLAAMRSLLKPDGLFVAAFIGGQSLTQLRQSWLAADADHLGGAELRVAPMIDLRDAGALLQAARFGLPVVDIETHTIRYADPLKLMREIKALGGANPLAQRPQKLVTKSHLYAVAQHYADMYADEDGRISATLEIVWMNGWKPHESQQKPLKPGSAKHSLADFLNDKSAPKQSK